MACMQTQWLSTSLHVCTYMVLDRNSQQKANLSDLDQKPKLQLKMSASQPHQIIYRIHEKPPLHHNWAIRSEMKWEDQFWVFWPTPPPLITRNYHANHNDEIKCHFSGIRKLKRKGFSKPTRWTNFSPADRYILQTSAGTNAGPYS